MNKKPIITALLAAVLALTSCHHSAQYSEAGQQTDSIEVATNADTLRLAIKDVDSTASDSAAPVKLKLPLDSVVIEMVNSTNMTCVTGEWYTIEHRVNGKWETLPIKPRKDGLIYGFDDIGHELAGHTYRHFTIHIQPDMYDFEQGREYRIGKEYRVSGEKKPSIVYCNFITD
ncbi:MAG: hypothetical protein IJV28_07780 [Paludibacteraceae bacterium]|nr:hypothetical protein [Paludibacteraceae bacterium]